MACSEWSPSRSLWKKVHQLEKSTLAVLVALVTNHSYVHICIFFVFVFQFIFVFVLVFVRRIKPVGHKSPIYSGKFTASLRSITVTNLRFNSIKRLHAPRNVIECMNFG